MERAITHRTHELYRNTWCFAVTDAATVHIASRLIMSLWVSSVRFGKENCIAAGTVFWLNWLNLRDCLCMYVLRQIASRSLRC